MVTPPQSAPLLALLDGGTTRTRLRVWDGERVLSDLEIPLGARDSAQHPDGPAAWRVAVAALIREARREFELGGVVACGMLTSPSGLLEVPHLLAPLSYDDLAAGLRGARLDGGNLVQFIPGVRTAESDVMRGEETEVTGLRQHLKLTGRVNFLHFGSHDKLVVTDDQGIQGSVTNLNGELLSVLSQHTILRESTAPLEHLEVVDRGWWQRGLDAARQHGLSRAAFMVRLGGLLEGASPLQGSSFLLGALAEADWRWIEAAGREVPTLLYGRASAAAPLSEALRDAGYPVRVVSEADSQLAAVIGAAQLYRRWRQLQDEGAV